MKNDIKFKSQTFPMDITINGLLFELKNFVAGQYLLIDDMLAVTGAVSLERIEYVQNMICILDNEISFSLYAYEYDFCGYLHCLDYLLATPLMMARFYKMVSDRLDINSIKLVIPNKFHRLNILRYTYPSSVSIHASVDCNKCKSSKGWYYHLKIDGKQRNRPTTTLNELSEQFFDYLSIYTSSQHNSTLEIHYIWPMGLEYMPRPDRLYCSILMNSTEHVTIADNKFDLTSYVTAYLDKTFAA